MSTPARLSLFALAFAAACSEDERAPRPPGPPPPPVFYEIEPNDSPYLTDFLGGVDSYSHFFIEGHVEGPGGLDRYDHFEFFAEEPMELEFYLQGFDPFADLDLCVWDPDLEEIVACFDDIWNPEYGTFSLDWAGKGFVLVVEAYEFDSAYSLEIIGYPYLAYSEEEGDGSGDEFAATALEPTDQASDPNLESSGIGFPDGRPTPHKERHRATPAEDDRGLAPPPPSRGDL